MAHLTHSPHFGKNAVLQRNAEDKERLRVRMEKQSQQRRRDRNQIAADITPVTAPILPTQPSPSPEKPA